MKRVVIVLLLVFAQAGLPSTVLGREKAAAAGQASLKAGSTRAAW